VEEHALAGAAAIEHRWNECLGHAALALWTRRFFHPDQASAIAQTGAKAAFQEVQLAFRFGSGWPISQMSPESVQ
jgi:hypothetical protein